MLALNPQFYETEYVSILQMRYVSAVNDVYFTDEKIWYKLVKFPAPDIHTE